jgi:tRNA (guanine-N7-)-methyltransferase
MSTHSEETPSSEIMIQLKSIITTAIRHGRVTPSQQDALSRLFPLYGITLEAHQPILPQTLFKQASEYILEIGFGMGHSLLDMATTHPDCAYIGIELHKPGIGRLLCEMEARNIHNIRVIHGNALDAIDHAFPAESFHTLQIFFPDPWPKTKHFKRRLIQEHTVNRMARILKPGGLIHIATDWEPYAKHILKTLEASPLYINAHGSNQFAPRPESRPLTKFETRGLRYGHGVWDIQFMRSPL